MNSKDLRSAFFKFFQDKNHELVESAPIVIKDDPTLMFTNAGMNQFKDLFLGNKEAKFPRVVDTQKCLRVSGKHNDLEEVGVDTYHHTMFEMLGNWSFGDFFKAEMIPWAWEFLTEKLQLSKDRLYVTIFEGDKADNLEVDKEAYETWKKIIDEDRIIKASKKDNFWEMGETGPCGPCSEIHIDLRSQEERNKIDGKELVNQDHPEVIEIWNLVFMEFNRLKDRSLKALPAKHVDTGMGFERLCMAVQNKKSNYDTDLFAPLLSALENQSSKKYTATDSKEDIAFRVIVDHLRAIAFSIADGQLPSNTGAGYVIRRILRRAIRYGYSFLNFREAFIYKLVDPLIESLGDHFSELSVQETIIKKVIQEEENGFLKTLDKGIQLFENYVVKQQEIVDGQFAFELYDTFGFPIDLTQLLAQEKGLEVDMKGFELALNKQKDRSRSASKMDTGDWVTLIEDEKEEFIGYDRTKAKVKVTKYREVEQKGKKQYQLVFNLTPFYPEGGGQVGDQGYIEQSGKKYSVIDTKKENNLIIHFLDKLPDNLEAGFEAVVNSTKRRSTMGNHSATHLLHQALREVLGEHVEQKGSLVHPDYLRFDFSHFQKVEEEQLDEIERKINERVLQNLDLEEKRNLPIDEAKEMGAMALFGEKYGDTVRVIQFGESIELCGGTHVKSTGQVGLVKLISEGAVAAGIRRIEAISGRKAIEHVNKQDKLLAEINSSLKQPKNVLLAVNNLLEEQKKLQKEVESFKRKEAQAVKEKLLNKVKGKADYSYLIEEVDLDADSIKNLAFQLKGSFDKLFLLLATKEGNKPSITILISEDLAKEKDWNAGAMVRDLAKHIQGGGGGQAFFATAGGKDVNGLDKVLIEAEKLIS